jgi:hypothetical protein
LYDYQRKAVAGKGVWKLLKKRDGESRQTAKREKPGCFAMSEFEASQSMIA